MKTTFQNTLRVLLAVAAVCFHLIIFFYQYPKTPFLFFTSNRVESIHYGYVVGKGVVTVKLDETAKDAMVRDLRNIVITKPVSRHDFDILKPDGSYGVSLPFIITMKNGDHYRMEISKNWDSGLYFLKIMPYDDHVIPRNEISRISYQRFRIALFPAAISAAKDIYWFDGFNSSYYEYENMDEQEYHQMLGKYGLEDYFE